METGINWIVKQFEELDVDELYCFLVLRNKVFVVEQNSVYQDVDYKDQKATHVMGYVEGNLVTYCRIFKSENNSDTASIGRVLVDSHYRSLGLGRILIDKAVALLVESGESEIIISAQSYLQKFYEESGFIRIGDEYIEDGIPHIPMKSIIDNETYSA